MSTTDTTPAFAAGPTSDVIHLDDDCPYAQRAKNLRPTTREAYAHRRLCRWCDPDVTIDTSAVDGDHRTCATCGDELDADGACSWCERFEEAVCR